MTGGQIQKIITVSVIANKMRRKARGFTLIELLVVATIILVLSSMGLVSYQAAQKKGRDSKRKSDLEQVRAALEMYRSDYGHYPIANNWTDMINELNNEDENYLSSIPADPKGYSYYYNSSDGYTYYLCAYLETGGTDDCGNYCGPAPGNCNYRVTNP